MKKRVYCLYRVSTDQQLDYEDYRTKTAPDIPLQRKACQKFAAQHSDWEIVEEFYEEGVSGHKVRAANRDKIQIIKEEAKKHKFDILLVFLFDRLGRISDETPFLVEWFVQNGISVWSTQEGEQRFDNHIDRLTNYIRFWQADGESRKTGIRTKTKLGQLVEDGYYKGGSPAYGYRLEKCGRFNRKKQEVHNLVIDEDEEATVRLIYYLYVIRGMGDYRISTYLNKNKIWNRNNTTWTQATVRNMLRNETYTGVLRSGESRSKPLEHLCIIPANMYNRAQEIRKQRAEQLEEDTLQAIPRNTRGESLAAGMVFCGHCGSRLNLTSNKKTYTKKNGEKTGTIRNRYACYGKTRRHLKCDGQSGYTMHILDDIIDTILHKIFNQITSIPKADIFNACHNESHHEKSIALQHAKQQFQKAEKELVLLKNEVVNVITGNSNFTTELLQELIDTAAIKYEEQKQEYEKAQSEFADTQSLYENLQSQYDDVISWSKLYDSADIEVKKMIVASLIRRINVYNGYRLEIRLNIPFVNLDSEPSIQYDLDIEEKQQVV